VPNGSPFEIGKVSDPHRACPRAYARDQPRAHYVNQVGGQDELVFDGRSFILNRTGDIALSMPGWEEAIELTRWTRSSEGWQCAAGSVDAPSDALADTYNALMTGLRDYVDKNGFPGSCSGSLAASIRL
jgi:NAD+ synthase